MPKFDMNGKDIPLKNNDSVNETEESFHNPGVGIRHVQSLLLALCVFSGYLQRVNLSVTIVAIAEDEYDNTTKSDEAPSSAPTYPWDNKVRSYLLSAFFIGYLIMNFPAALVGTRVNNKAILLITFIINAFVSLVTPLIIMLDYTGESETLKSIFQSFGPGNWKILIVVRCIQGLLQAFMFPTIHGIIARWAPPNERSRLVGFIMSGIPLGTMMTLTGSGLISSSSLGWPFVFYISGLGGLLWSVIWWIYGANSPAEHKGITRPEYLYITNSIATTSSPRNRRKKIPWKSILTSLPVWAIIVSHTGHNWGFWLLLSEMPTFLHSILGFNIKADGLLSALPYLGMWLLQFPVMYMADKFNKRKITSLTTSRKLWNTIGMWGAALSLLILGYLDDNMHAAVILYICAVTIGCCSNVGFNINHMDLSPNYAGILMGLSNGFASSGGLGAPLIVAYIVNDMKSVLQWRMVFFVGTALTFFSNLFFIIFASGKTQSWNNELDTL